MAFIVHFSPFDGCLPLTLKKKTPAIYNGYKATILLKGTVGFIVHKQIQNLKFVRGRVENIMGKGENAGYQHFLVFPSMFSKGISCREVESCDCMVQG